MKSVALALVKGEFYVVQNGASNFVNDYGEGETFQFNRLNATNSLLSFLFLFFSFNFLFFYFALEVFAIIIMVFSLPALKRRKIRDHGSFKFSFTLKIRMN